MRIRVADVPFVAVDAEAAGVGDDQVIVLTLNTGRRIPLDDTHPLVIRGDRDAPRPYVELENGLAARVGRSLYYRLVELAVERQGEIGLWSCCSWFALAPTDPA